MLLRFAFIVCLFITKLINGYGFSEYTLVRTLEGYESICQIYENLSDKEQKVLSYNLSLNHCHPESVALAGQSEASCYFEIGFDKNGHGGFHWDVVDRHGHYVNVYPGGKQRAGTKKK